VWRLLTTHTITWLIAFLLVCPRAHASSFRIDFESEVDLSAFGGSSSNSFVGSVTWDSTAVPIPPGIPGNPHFPVVDAAVTFNGLATSLTDQHIELRHDLMYFNFVFSPSLDFGGDPEWEGIIEMFARLRLPANTFDLSGLPDDLGFLALVQPDSDIRAFVRQPGIIDSSDGLITSLSGVEIDAPEVPEPASMALTAFGLALLARSHHSASRKRHL